MAEKASSKNGPSASTSGTHGLKDIIERTFLAGMGAAAITKDRVQELVEELVSKGQINADEGRDVVDRLVARTREEARSVLSKADSSLQSAYRGLGLGSKSELDDMALRVEQLEHRVRLLEEQADTSGGA